MRALSNDRGSTKLLSGNVYLPSIYTKDSAIDSCTNECYISHKVLNSKYSKRKKGQI